MAINLESLAAASGGDPIKKVAVSKEWLTEVHRELSELERLRETHALGDRVADMGEKLMGMAGAFRVAPRA